MLSPMGFITNSYDGERAWDMDQAGAMNRKINPRPSRLGDRDYEFSGPVPSAKK